mgnify:FL=1
MYEMIDGLVMTILEFLLLTKIGFCEFLIAHHSYADRI